MPTRLIDLHIPWLLQYAPDSATFDSTDYPEIPPRIPQTAGYLQATRAALVACARSPADWARHPAPWLALSALLARVEAEFSGRLLIGLDDFDRWEDDKQGMTWGVLGVAGFDATVRAAEDFVQIAPLFERGVRVFQPIATTTSLLGGAVDDSADRGLTPLGHGFLDALLAAIPTGPGRTPRALVDLTGMNSRTVGDLLDWFEVQPSRAERLIPILGHGGPVHDGCTSPHALPVPHLRRLRALGGFLGLGPTPPYFATPEEIEAVVRLVAAIPFLGEPGIQGVGIGTNFLGIEAPLPRLKTAEDVVTWALARFDKSTANALLHDNARHLLAAVTGATHLV